MYVERTLEGVIKRYLSKKEIIAVIGPRQSGKTTMIKRLFENLSNVNIVTLEDVEVLDVFRNDVKSFVELYVKGFDYVFIDEIQYAEESGKQLKYIYDNTDVKLFISGSASAEVSVRSLKYLVGRIFIFELLPFSFEEYLRAKEFKLFELYKRRKFGGFVLKRLQKYVDEFIIYGGYPRVVLSENKDEKLMALENIYNTLLLREVKNLFGLGNSDKLIKLIKSLSLQTGNLINYTELCNATGFGFKRLKEVLNILEALYIVQRCSPFSKNPRSELVKNPKIYFVDLGLRNAIINNFSTERTDSGVMYENLVFSEFLKKGEKPNYWRTKSGAEIDFIRGGIPVEVKTSPKIGKSLHSFISKYSPPEAYVVSRVNAGTQKVAETKLNFVSFPEFI